MFIISEGLLIRRTSGFLTSSGDKICSKLLPIGVSIFNSSSASSELFISPVIITFSLFKSLAVLGSLFEILKLN